jgi:hypothetical protein
VNRPSYRIYQYRRDFTLGVELGPKRLQMLSELLPAGATVALFMNPRNANAADEDGRQ